MGSIVIPSGTRGFDINSPVDTEGAVAFFERGFRFAVRYVRRAGDAPYNLTAPEIQRLHDAGLAVGIVQHVESETSWLPDVDKGRRYGQTAADACAGLSIPAGVVVWCDLEGVATTAAASDVIAYCNAWFDAVAAGGWTPGLYVGWHCGLSPAQLYALKFTHYWGSYNLNSDEEPATRGIQMKQHAGSRADVPAGMTLSIDTDTVTADHLGGLPTMYAPDGWAP